jgi:uncharacterized alpha-E superfamily protein
VVDTKNPRAIAYQLEELKAHIDLLPKDNARPRLSDAQAVCLRASTTLKLTDINQMRFSDNCDRSSLHDLLSNLSTDMNTLSEVLAHKYFSHTQPSRQLVGSANVSNKKTENDKRTGEQ